jgi:hypothetical protein
MSADRRPEQLFEQLARRFLSDPAVGEGTGFGSNPGLRTGGKIFAMLVKGELVVKLPRDRVDEVVASGAGSRFDPGHGRVMKEWVSVPTQHGRRWGPLANEALEFVGSSARRKR